MDSGEAELLRTSQKWEDRKAKLKNLKNEKNKSMSKKEEGGNWDYRIPIYREKKKADFKE